MSHTPIELEGFSDFEKQLMLTWTQAHFSTYLVSNPEAHINDRIDRFSDILESSIYVVTDLRKRFGE